MVAQMTKEPPEIFDIEAIAERTVDKAKLRARAFEAAMVLVKGYGGEQCRPVEIAVLAKKIFVWFETGEFPKK